MRIIRATDCHPEPRMPESLRPAARKTHLLLILDGWGEREAAPDNAITSANCPNWRRIWATNPHTLIQTDGLAVGLPAGQMGNSEVGHMNLGAGRIVYQDLTRINLALETGQFEHNVALNQACASVRRNGGTLHVMGLLSEGGVHSLEAHIFAMLRLAHARKVRKIAVHVFLDGRDTPPKSAAPSIAKLQAICDELGNVKIASVAGRYFAMDRDQRWDRVKRSFDAICDARSDLHELSALAALDAGYARGESDEFVRPTVIAGGCKVHDGDAIVFMNYRSDRARELSQAFVDSDFPGFERTRPVLLNAFVSLTEYAKNLDVSAVAFAPQSMQNTLTEVLAALGRTQLRIAETEKYAHVTFFFSGGVEAPYPGERRILVPSPKVATYDLQPEMSVAALCDQLVSAITGGEFDFIVCNIANPDMVGHTGILAAAILAVEAVDAALARIESAILTAGGTMLVTADHGNLEEMWDFASNQPNTQHSMNPVPLVLVGAPNSGLTLRSGGALKDIAPTLLKLMQIPQPAEMTGETLL
jgi:2,3-bisphosphoglycerate-independent phosphoglycerate mutase